eukprot:TRINITY_DN1205_c2_g1_i1.p1 TRINITY_DN1205_c2_g1~~TRINITY_DN1205_c2_g1_i1.p1  ORF type:complete len:459 (+),score=149.38 TRINITY_DN1205_c2_g1_i1:171-1379(+)
MGGYHNWETSGSLVPQSTIGNAYNFNFWQHLDIFCYFSHERVTIPPSAWTNVAHRHGVQMIGTFITEWEQGAIENALLLQDIEFYADKLVAIMTYYQFDGWLINIETKLEDSKAAEKMRDFVRILTEKSHASDPKSLIIWYDSVLETGELKWQNHLNASNRIFFDACDGIFLNYNWKPELIKTSVENSGNRSRDIYTSCDIWGRGTFGGGGFSAHVASEIARENKTALALFGAGWTFERNQLSKLMFQLDERRLWEGLGNVEVLKNGDARDGTNFWNSQVEFNWKVAQGDVTCFQVENTGNSRMSQEISLKDHFDENFLDEQPPIVISASFRGENLGNLTALKIQVSLLDAEKSTVKNITLLKMIGCQLFQVEINLERCQLYVPWLWKECSSRDLQVDSSST